MNWFNGSIADAIKTAKTRQAIFIVYVEGKDDKSHLMSEVLNNGEICDGLSSDKFVAIKLPSDDVGYKQFVEIYKLVPIPSIFFIGNSGAPLDIVAADSSRSNLEAKIKEAIAKCNVSLPVNTPSINTPESASMDSPVPTTSQSTEPLVSQPGISSENSTDVKTKDVEKPSLEERVEKAKLLLEKKKQEKEIKEMEEEKEKEFERRRIGQEMLKAQKNKQDKELQEMIKEREREKKENAAAKQRILDQIAQDRADKAERELRMKTGNVSPPNQNKHSAPAVNNPTQGNTTRIQFKLPTGEAKTHSFPLDTTISQVREFIDNNIELSFRDYRLATTFPRREFTAEDDANTLQSLNLIPTGVILILPLSNGSVKPYTRDWFKIVSDLFWDMVQPAFSLANYVQNYFTSRPSGGGPSSEPSTSTSPQPSQSSQSGRAFVRRSGNIHSLRDVRDENDENNTWNGNSTQQK